LVATGLRTRHRTQDLQTGSWCNLSAPKPPFEGFPDKLVFGNDCQLQHCGRDDPLADIAMTAYIKVRPDEPMFFRHQDFPGGWHMRQSRLRFTIDVKSICRKTDRIARHRQYRPPAKSRLNPDPAPAMTGIGFIAAD